MKGEPDFLQNLGNEMGTGRAGGGGWRAEHARELLALPSAQEQTPLLFTWFKFVASWLSVWAYVLGGLAGQAWCRA